VPDESTVLLVTRFVGFDLETTGVSSFMDAPVSYGFVEIGVAPESSPVLNVAYVNPGRLIPPGASAIHGITDEQVANATPLAEAVEVLATTVCEIWTGGGAIVGMNVSYDLTMVDSLCRRLEIPGLRERGPIGPVLDILVLDRHFDKWRKGSRKLVDLCRHYGVDLHSAHSAGDDAHASLLVLAKLRERFSDIDLLESENITVTLRSWYQDWLASYSSFLVRKGRAPIAENQYEWPVHADESTSSKLVS
jgi:DNA polymerase-3 subunit epsilon